MLRVCHLVPHGPAFAPRPPQMLKSAFHFVPGFHNIRSISVLTWFVSQAEVFLAPFPFGWKEKAASGGYSLGM